MKHSIPVVDAVKFNVDDKMAIVDPCYVDSPDDIKRLLMSDRPLGVLLDDCAGDWIGEIEFDSSATALGGDGRVSSLRAVRLDERGRQRHADTGLQPVHDDNGVDSGQMYIGGLENLPLDYDRLLRQYNIDPDKPFGGDNYSGANIIAAEGGVVSSTGYGDGSYPVYVAYDRDQHPVLVEVRFLEEEEEEDSNCCERCGTEITSWDTYCYRCERVIEEEEED